MSEKNENATQRTEKIVSTITRTIVFVFRLIYTLRLSFLSTSLFAH